jgi:alpha-L-arabinofuranosidase
MGNEYGGRSRMKSQISNLRTSLLTAAVASLLGSGLASAADPGKLVIHADQEGVKMSPTFYGLMTEEINHAYDGGLYGELIQNRIFKDPAGGGRRRRNGGGGNAGAQANGTPPVAPHWSIVTSKGAQGTIALDNKDPVNTTALTTSLRLDIANAADGQRVGVANDGFYGIPVYPNTKYTASFYAKGSEDFTGPLTVDIESNDGATVVGTAQVAQITSKWQQYKVTFTTGQLAASDQYRFVISAASKGSVWFNLVSLFPPTYKDRANGNRIDLMQALADLHPGFLRLPGGNYLEGNQIADRFEFKNTIGPLEDRPGHMGPWGYRSYDGLGLLEFLEWCEDLNMDPVLAVYSGYSLQQVRVPAGPQLKPFVDDALDEIEYVVGDKDTKWGAQRIKDGHPEPFKLTYVEIGNEDYFDNQRTYDGRFAQFFDAIRAKYPKLQLIASAPNLVRSRTPDAVDDHLYLAPRLLERQAHRHDRTNRNGPKIFMGEWASQDGNPTPTMNSALGDAAFLTGLEHNADVVIMECYAPLLVNVNRGAAQWPTNLIGYNAVTNFGSPSYYAQKMFATNRGNRVVPVDITPEALPVVKAVPPHGQVGVGTWGTNVDYKDIKVTDGDKTLFESDFSKGTASWTLGDGEWQVEDGALHQTSNATDCRATVGDSSWTDYTISLKARRNSGGEGFLVMFHAVDKNNYLWWNIGGWGNTRSTVEKSQNGEKQELGRPNRQSIESNRWYDLRVEVKGSDIKCYMDNKLITEATDEPVTLPGPLFSSANVDDATGDIILKVVNTYDTPQNLQITVPAGKTVDKTAVADVLTGELEDVNDLENPQKVVPHHIDITDAGNDFTHEFGPRSVTVIRLKTH